MTIVGANAYAERVASDSYLQGYAHGWLRRAGVVVLAGCGLLCGVQRGVAQELPDLTQIHMEAAAAMRTMADVPAGGVDAGVDPQAVGSLSGVVTDVDGAVVKGAQVTLHGSVTGQAQAITDSGGRFTFPRVAAQSFTLTVDAAGFAQATAAGTVVAGQAQELPAIVLRAASSQQVEAISQQAQAEIEVKQEETQRLFGVAPNFFVVYDWHAQPLDKRQKFELSWRTAIDPVNVLIDGGLAGIEQAGDALGGYKQGAAGYFKRFGAASGDLIAGTFIGGAILPSLFHQDPRYFYMGPSRSVTRRALYALSSAFICRGDNGRWQPNYSSVLGDIAAGGISNLYYPSTDRHSAGLVVENGLISAGLDGVGSLVQEFFFRKVTPGTHKGSNATP
jgi:hypothetical protein